MTKPADGHERRRWRGLGLSAVIVAALSGCATTSIEEIAPVAATAKQPLPELTSAIPTPSTAPEPASASVAAAPEAAGGRAVAAAGGAAAAGGEGQGSGNNTGRFPNLNVVPVAAAPQLTASERRAKLAELEAARKKAVEGVSGKTQSSEARLKKLAKSHAKDALEKIEGQ
jgi:hypothetical protein